MENETAEAIKRDYEKGAYSPLQLALKYKVEVADVYRAIEMEDMLTVQLVGDQVDNAGPGVPVSPGSLVEVPYTKN